MDKFNLLEDIAKRTGGDIYVGVVGPVRTGKSTFIKRFMQSVLDNIEDVNERQRAVDELPQSADGKTIMTTQPRFVPNEAVKVSISENMQANVRMIDCVGYLVEGAEGHKSEGKERMVRTPWSEKEMPFEKAAEIGTEKVIRDHSTIAVLVTTDGTIADIPRTNYIAAEERVVGELKSLGKPFIVLLNSKKPQSNEAQKIRGVLEEKYAVPVVAADVLNMSEQDMAGILETVLLEFPIKQIDAVAPKWIQALSVGSDIVKEAIDAVMKVAENAKKMKDYLNFDEAFDGLNYLDPPSNIILDAGQGRVEITLSVKEGLFYDVLSSECNESVKNDFDLFYLLKTLSKAKAKTQKLCDALKQAEETGYGVVVPSIDEMSLDTPEMVKQGGQFGVKLSAKAPSLHIIKVDVETEVSPIVGSEEQSEDLVKSLISNPQNDDIWDANIFGKTLRGLVNDGLQHKLFAIPADAKEKMQKTLGRIVNEGKGGVLCILL